MSDQANEQDAMRTTIVGGRPPGSGRANITVPQGIEVLVKKAAVDAEFRELLLDQRGGAAAVIGLELDPAESDILTTIPRDQLAQIIGVTVVPVEQRRVFLGRVAAAMLAALGAGLVGCEPELASRGVRPGKPEKTSPPPTAPPNQPTNSVTSTNTPAVAVGLRPTPPPSSFPSRGMQPDRP